MRVIAGISIVGPPDRFGSKLRRARDPLGAAVREIGFGVKLH